MVQHTPHSNSVSRKKRSLYASPIGPLPEPFQMAFLSAPSKVVYQTLQLHCCQPIRLDQPYSIHMN